ncbi:hypothetical protein GCM10010486_62280 [Nonomuraea roseoviolacea subsp. carminata]
MRGIRRQGGSSTGERDALLTGRVYLDKSLFHISGRMHVVSIGTTSHPISPGISEHFIQMCATLRAPRRPYGSHSPPGVMDPLSSQAVGTYPTQPSGAPSEASTRLQRPAAPGTRTARPLDRGRAVREPQVLSGRAERP